jgi:hypothetical protein
MPATPVLIIVITSSWLRVSPGIDDDFSVDGLRYGHGVILAN